jgi:hypothetical protein
MADHSLEALWSFEASGADSSGNQHTATPNNISYTAGQFGQAASFNGSSSYFATSYSGIQGSGARTFVAWIKTSSCRGPVCDVITYGSEANGQRIEWSIEDASMGLRIWADYIVYSAPAINDGNWHLIAVTLPAGGSLNQVQMYLDGGLLTTVSSSLRPTTVISSGNAHTISIGRMYPGASIMGTIAPNGAAYFNGSIDELRIYSRQLSAAEILQLKTNNKLG